MKIFILALLLSTACFAAEIPIAVSNIREVSHLPPIQKDKVGFCYAYATAALLDQFVCNLNKKECGEQDHFSVLDIVAKTSAAYPAQHGGGDVFLVLEMLRQNPKLAKESCAPIDKTLLIDDLQFYENGKDWRTKIQENFSKARDNALYCQRNVNPHTEEFNKACGLMASRLKFKNTKQMKNFISFNEAIEKVIFPQNCMAQRVSLPKFTVKRSFGRNIEDLRLKITNGLAQNRLVQINLCLDPHAENTKACLGHATVISGERDNCSGKCDHQYKLYDSMGLVWINNDSQWVSGDELLDRTKNMAGDSQPILTWLE